MGKEAAATKGNRRRGPGERFSGAPSFLILAPDAAGVGGIARVVRALLQALAEVYGPGRVGLLAVWAQEGLDRLGIQVLCAGPREPRVSNDRVSVRLRVRYVWAALRQALRLRPPAVIVAAHAHLAPVAWACRLVSGRRYAVWCHGYETWGRLRPWVAFSIRVADVIFTHSRFSAEATERACGLERGRVRVIHPGFGHEPRLREAAGHVGPRVLTVARLDPRDAYKGLDTLIHAFPMVRARVPRAELVVVGDGPDLPRLDATARYLGVEDAVTFLGRVEDEELSNLYASAALFALPARASLGPHPEGEGFGLVFCEAQAAGLAVVAGAAGPAPEVVEDGVTGRLVDPRDPQAVADAVASLLQDREHARAMGAAGARRVATHFSYERFREQIGELFQFIPREPSWPGYNTMVKGA